MWTLVTFAFGDMYTTARAHLCATASSAGLQTIEYSLNDLKALELYNAHAEWFQWGGCPKKCERCKQSNGWFAWKPLLLLQALKNVPQDSWVMYMDCGDIADFSIITKAVENCADWCAFFRIPRGRNRNVMYGRQGCFDVMKCEMHKNFIQVEAGICAFKNCRRSIQFLEEWFEWCVDSRANGDHPSGGESPDFVASRHDQTILTNLIAREHLPIITDQWNHIQCNIEYIDKKQLRNRPIDEIVRRHPCVGKRR
jgi:hypothetical protein